MGRAGNIPVRTCVLPAEFIFQSPFGNPITSMEQKLKLAALNFNGDILVPAAE
jgi:hypothetical protein